MQKLPMKALRVAKDLTQADVAEKMGISKSTYANWENYVTFPSAIQLISLAKIFECSLDAFYFPEDAN